MATTGIAGELSPGDPVLVRAVVDIEHSSSGSADAGDHVRIGIAQTGAIRAKLWVPKRELAEVRPRLVGDTALDVVMIEGVLTIHIRRRKLSGDWEETWLPLGSAQFRPAGSNS